MWAVWWRNEKHVGLHDTDPWISQIYNCVNFQISGQSCTSFQKFMKKAVRLTKNIGMKAQPYSFTRNFGNLAAYRFYRGGKKGLHAWL